MISINNRRYIGSKNSLLDAIDREIKKCIAGDFTFADPFAGTGVVAYHYAKQGHEVIVNDMLYSNYVAYQAWMGNGKYSKKKIREELIQMNQIASSKNSKNYFSNIYGEKYYSESDAKAIGAIREYIEENKDNYTQREYFILLTSLMYAADKIANTVGHYESFLTKRPIDRGVFLDSLDIKATGKSHIYNADANTIINKLSADVVYLDPPYNARQYVNFYHVLENLTRWDKPTEFEGNSMKFKRDTLKSGYSRSKAPELMQELVSSLNCKFIIVSYNNTYNANSSASNNKIQEQDLINILKSRGSVNKVEYDYRFFNAGKTNFNNHKEYLFTCTVER